MESNNRIDEHPYPAPPEAPGTTGNPASPGEFSVAKPPGARPVEEVSRAPWGHIVPPEGFEIDRAGTFSINRKDERTLIAGPVWVEAKTRDVTGHGWGNLVKWVNQDGHLCEFAFPGAQLHAKSQSPVIAHLADSGLHLIPGRENELLRYLGSYRVAARVDSASQTGWLTANDHAMPSYVLPNEVISARQDIQIHFQPERWSPGADSLHRRGSLKGWESQVLRRCEGNPIWDFAILVALTPPLLKFAEMDNFGIHFFGASSVGKTTGLQIAQSVWGDGSDPAASSTSGIQRWNTTANALEGLAAAHNDGLLALDEMGTFTGKDFGAAVYNLMGGQGKARMNEAASLRPTKTWHAVVISSGEISVQAKIAESGKRVMAGQTNRFLDIPMAGITVDLTSDMPIHEVASALKEGSAFQFGHLGPAFVEALLLCFGGVHALRQRLKELVDRFAKQLCGAFLLEAHQRRGIRRFALIRAAGELAAEMGVLKMDADRMESAVSPLAYRWLAEQSSERDRFIAGIREFILRHKDAKLPNAQDIEAGTVRTHTEIAGYYFPRLEAFAFFGEALAEASGTDAKTAAGALKSCGLLKTNEHSRNDQKVTIPFHNKRTRMFLVRTKILEYEIGSGR